MKSEAIYHICRRDEWETAERQGLYPGSSQDRADGFIHFSARDQIEESAAKHRAGQDDLVLVAVDPQRLGSALRWEESRGGRLFPHLYGPLPLVAVTGTWPLMLDAEGRHRFPEDY
jgi:uncharacterized protein (DUF952 family)